MTKETVLDFTVGERIDKMLSVLYPEYSRSAIEKLIGRGDITVNGKAVKTKYVLKPGDKITVNFNELSKAIEQIEIPVLFENDDVLVLNKPIGVLAHTKGTFSREGTVASFIQPKLTGSDEWRTSNRAGIVHRLDRGTSGVMICAKTEDSQAFLQKQFAKRNVKKTYQAIISGELDQEKGMIDVPIERNPKKPATFRAGVNGKVAQTEFEILKTDGLHSLVQLKPKTGRTHQLRVHMQYLKHPIVGDDFYGGEQAERLMLHAKELEITLPSKERVTYAAPVPIIFKKYFDE